MTRTRVSVFWFRHDLRLEDNCGLYQALCSGELVLPIYIFESTQRHTACAGSAARMQFVIDRLNGMRRQLQEMGSDLAVFHDDPAEVFERLQEQYEVTAVHINREYEPHNHRRDRRVKALLEALQIPFKVYKDRCILDYDEVLKTGGMPYTVFTPYKKKWLEIMHRKGLPNFPLSGMEDCFLKGPQGQPIPDAASLGMGPSPFEIPSSTIDLKMIQTYDQTRDIPSLDTSRLGIHLHFGTVSSREVVRRTYDLNETFVSQLIWRDFFTSILYHFPEVRDLEFRSKYRGFPWRKDEEGFERWCQGRTGYPLVDAGMRELNNTGFMHNRARMIVAGFLTKHLLIDWRLGMRYFAEKLLDYDMALNNGNWQWAAGTGCDASPYFRIFNPITQAKKFDPKGTYVNQWIPELNTPDYPEPMVDHKMARERALDVFKSATSAVTA